MAAALPSSRPLTLLEQWLEGLPSSFNSTIPVIHRDDPSSAVKKEKSVDPSSLPFPPPQTHATFLLTGQMNQQLARPSQTYTHTSPSHHLQQQASQQTTQASVQVKVENTIDSQSVAGSFGWEDVGNVAVPVIFRESERLVPVRILENKIINFYSNQMPWSVFSCINIRSSYVTQAEASLLTEINSMHCDYSFGYEAFTQKDIVVSLKDVLALHSFMETSKSIFQSGLVGIDWLGFLSISGSVVPYAVKPSESGTPKRYVPQSLIEQKVLMIKVSRVAMDEWDAAYLKMLLIYAGLDKVSFPPEDALCSVDDLQWNNSLTRSIQIEDCTSQVVQLRTLSQSTALKTEFQTPPPTPQFSKASASSSSSTNYLSPPGMFGDECWMRASTASSPNTTLRSLHQVTQVEIGCPDVGRAYLSSINLKPYSTQRAVFVADAVSKLFPGVSILTVHHILEKIFQVKLYDYSRLHEDAFLRASYHPLQGDKLILVDVLRKCLPQLKQIILATRTLSNLSSIPFFGPCH